MRVLAALVLGLLGLWPSLVAAQTVKLGAVVPLTGRYGPGGAQVRTGYEIAVEQINASGGMTLAGKKTPLELVVLDDESDATKTVARLESLASQGVAGYLGGFGSDLHAAAASVADASGFSPGGTVCARPGSTDAMPMPAASISSTAGPYRVVEVITPPAFLVTDDAGTSARNCGGHASVIARSDATKQSRG